MAGNVKKLVIYGDDDSVVDNLLWEYEDFADAGCQSGCTLTGNPNVATEDVALAGNMSYGSCDALDANPVTGGLLLPSITSADQLFEQAVAEGRSWHASTGDDGGACSPVNAFGVPDAGVPGGANYPASSPYVTAVGGTTLFTDSNYNYAEEIAWTSGGGGISAVESAPAWQSGIVPSATLGSSVPAGRGVPDVSMDAGFYVPEAVVEQGAQVVVNGSNESVIGTSLSSPLAVGAWARFETARCNASSLGFAAQAYYALDTAGGPLSAATGFHDTTIGSNGFYPATPGWDYATGFGTIDLAKVNAALPAPAADCAPLGGAPTAHLSADHKTGKAPLGVSFSASASKAASGGSLAYYVLDYGDGSAVTVQQSPSFAAHAYQAPGSYTATLTVRSGDGVVSAPATLAVSVTGVPPSCSGIGQQVVTVPAGVSAGTEGVDLGQGADDMIATFFAEPGAASNQLVVNMEVKSLATIPPGFRWVTYFNIPEDSDLHYVAMVSADGVAPVFNYGTHGVLPVVGLGTFTIDGTLDAASNYNADGTITLVLDKSALGIQTGDKLTIAFLPSAFTEAGVEKDHVRAGINQNRREGIDELVRRQQVGFERCSDLFRFLVGPERLVRLFTHDLAVADRADRELANLEALGLRNDRHRVCACVLGEARPAQNGRRCQRRSRGCEEDSTRNVQVRHDVSPIRVAICRAKVPRLRPR